MNNTRMPALLLGLFLAATAHAELPPALRKAAADVAKVPAQQQALATDLEGALKVGVGEPDLQSMLRQAARQQYTAGQAAAFVQQLATVRRDGLPVALMRDKILEGMAKKVPAETILMVASQWQGALKDAESSVLTMEARGLKYASTAEREALLNLGAGLRQRYEAKGVLSSLAESATKDGRMTSSAEGLIAAGNLTELMLLHDATMVQALEVPRASLRAGYTPMQIQALQRNALGQLRQGVAVVDIVASMRRELRTEGVEPASPPLSAPGQLFGPGGSFPGGGGPASAPGGSFPGGGGPASAPGGSFPGGGGPASAPGGNFPGGGGPASAPGGNFPGDGGPTRAPGGSFPGGGGPASAPGGGFPQGRSG